MSIEIYIGFLLASSLILIIPGPTVILVVSQAIVHGRSSVVPLAGGVVAGDFTAMTLSLMGVGSLLAVSAELFLLLKWLGAFYLVYLGLRLWVSGSRLSDLPVNAQNDSARTLFRSSFIVTALNPKSIAFFIAFFPQFIERSASSVLQLGVLGSTFLLLAGINAVLYGFFAGQFREFLQKERSRKMLSRGGAAALIGAGVLTAGLQQR